MDRQYDTGGQKHTPAPVEFLQVPGLELGVWSWEFGIRSLGFGVGGWGLKFWDLGFGV